MLALLMSYSFRFLSNIKFQRINITFDISKRVSYNFCSFMISALFYVDKRTNHRISDSASFLKISCTQASIYCKFLLVLSDPLEKYMCSICFARAVRVLYAQYQYNLVITKVSLLT